MSRILVVDDEPAVCSLLRRALEREHAVEIAADAADARGTLERRPFDLVLTDLSMPGPMDGIGLFRWVRENRPGTDVILLTGVPTLESSLEAFRFGVFDYVVKPLDLDGLQKTVARCLERRRLVGELDDEKALRHTLLKAYRELAAMDGMRETFRRYLTKEVADKVLASPTPEALRGERRQVSVLFADIRRFTSFAESRTPEAAIAALNEVFARLNEVVARHGGIVSKFTGDGMMVLFGAPLDQPDHAQRAVDCAREMQRGLAAMNAGRVVRREPPLELGIGVNSGEVVAGSLGSIERREYTVIGSAVNLAARLEERAGPGQVLVGPATAGAVGDRASLRSLGLQLFDGYARSVSVFELDYA